MVTIEGVGAGEGVGTEGLGATGGGKLELGVGAGELAGGGGLAVGVAGETVTEFGGKAEGGAMTGGAPVTACAIGGLSRR